MSLTLTAPTPTVERRSVTTPIIACRPAVGSEPSAIVRVSRVETLTGDWNKDRELWDTVTNYTVEEIERLDTASLVSVADRLSRVIPREGDPSVLIDLTQVGKPFLRLVRERGLRTAPCVVDGSEGKLAWTIPSREMIATTMDLVGEKRLTIRKELEDARELLEQVRTFRTKGTSDDELRDWRKERIDLVLPTMLAVFWGEMRLRSTVRQPRPPRLPVEYKGIPASSVFPRH